MAWDEHWQKWADDNRAALDAFGAAIIDYARRTGQLESITRTDGAQGSDLRAV